MDGPGDLLPVGAIPGPRWPSAFAIREQLRFFRDPIRHMADLRARYGDLTRFRTAVGTVLVAIGPEYNRQLYQDTDLFHSRPIVLRGPHGSAQGRLRQSIFALNDDAHKAMRRHLLPLFQRSMMPAHQPAVRAIVDRATADWRPGEVRDLHREMHLLIWQIVRGLLYRLSEGDADGELHAALEHWMFRTFSPWVRLCPFNLPFTPYRRMLREADHLEATFLELMERRRAAGAGGADALSALVRLRWADGYVPLEFLVGHALTLFLVAYETTGNTLTWTLFLLSQFPETQQELLDELAGLGPEPGYARLEGAPLLTRALQESMRLLPAVPYSRRMSSRVGAIGRYTLPARAQVIFSHYMTHHLPEIYPDPERFDPARWETIRPSPAEYLPFGAGPRTCLGAALAQCVLRTAIARILPRWKITVVPHTRIDRQLGISLGPRGGLPVTLARQDRDLHRSPVAGNIRDMVELDRQEPARRVLAAA